MQFGFICRVQMRWDRVMNPQKYIMFNHIFYKVSLFLHALPQTNDKHVLLPSRTLGSKNVLFSNSLKYSPAIFCRFWLSLSK